MAEFNARVQVYSSGSEAASASPEPIKPEDLQMIAGLINQTTATLKNELEVANETPASGSIGLAEVDITFGIDFTREQSIGAHLVIPVITSVLSAGTKRGSTFQVHIKLTKQP